MIDDDINDMMKTPFYTRGDRTPLEINMDRFAHNSGVVPPAKPRNLWGGFYQPQRTTGEVKNLNNMKTISNPTTSPSYDGSDNNAASGIVDLISLGNGI